MTSVCNIKRFDPPSQKNILLKLIQGVIEEADTADVNKLFRLVLNKLGTSLGTYTAGKRAASAAAIGEKVSFSGVRMFWSDTDCFESGNCNNKPLECYCEWATQEMADNVQ